MSDSFQHEIPKGRVNLTVEIKTNGASKTLELPHKTLVFGDFSNGKSKGPLLERPRKLVSKFTRDSIMAEMNPELNLMVDNKLSSQAEEMQVKLEFKALNDFHPESIVDQVPCLKRLLAVRNLLKDLRSNLVDNAVLKNKLAAIMSDENSRQAFKQEYLDTLITYKEIGEE